MKILNKNTVEKLDIIADNISNVGGPNFLGGGTGGSKTVAAKSQSRFDRMGNRKFENWQS
jgi:hypothetical protein